MKAIMYHYVRPDSPTMPWFRYLALDDFRKQLDYFADHFGFIGRNEFLDVLNGHQPVPPDKVLLTFDDGLKDHASYVLPELERRSLFGVFYVNSAPISRGTMLDVHRVHCLLGTCGGVKLCSLINELVTDEMLSSENIEKFQNQTYTRQNNDSSTKWFKRVFNYFVEPQYREGLLDQMMAQVFEEGKVNENYYLNDNDLRTMKDAGMIVGNHTVNHRLMATLSERDQRQEIVEGFAVLENILGDDLMRNYAHPYGGFHSFNEDTISLLSELGCEFSFNVEQREITNDDFERGRQFLPRFDCNQFPNGQCPPVPL